MDPRIPFLQIPLADSRHPQILAAKSELDQGRIPPHFADIVYALTLDLRQALEGVAVLFAHNVASLNKNLALTIALWNIANRDRMRTVLWHHDLAWTTPRYRAELHEGYPWEKLRKAWVGVKQVTISEMRRRELAELFRIDTEKIEVVPNGVDALSFHKVEHQTREFVSQLDLLGASLLLLLPVRITPRKNIELALQTAAPLRTHFPQLKLVVTGPLGPHNPANIKYFEKLLELRKALGLENVVCFLAESTSEYIPDEVISDFYHLADALFLPSYEEGFGIPVLEAGLANLPVFCSDIPPLRNLGGSEAVYFSPDDDPGRIAARMAEELASNRVFRLRARVREAYTWEGIYRRQIAPLLKG
jgi:glycosyltransferase involved in cell wall biosynthesis